MAGRTIATHDTQIMGKSTDESIKGGGNVARRTVQVRRYVAQRLACADRAVMTGQAIAGIGARMVKRHTSKGCGVMANVAFLIVRSGRYVVQELTHTDPIVVARRAAASGGIGMIIGARGERPRGMAIATILITGGTRIVRIGWHVRIEQCGKWFARGSNLRWYRTVITMARLAVGHNTVMIVVEGRREAFGVMTRAAINIGRRVSGYR